VPVSIRKSQKPEQYRLLSFLVCLAYLVSIGSIIAQASSRSRKKPSSTAALSPTASFSGGVGLIFPITPLSEDNLRYWFTPQVENAAALGRNSSI
jgi:hypothetical protein